MGYYDAGTPVTIGTMMCWSRSRCLRPRFWSLKSWSKYTTSVIQMGYYDAGTPVTIGTMMCWSRGPSLGPGLGPSLGV